MPSIEGCKADLALGVRVGLFRSTKVKAHDWKYRGDWNGNNRQVLPFADHPHGIARGGWRCYHCGKFAWDDSDTTYALSLAHAWNLIKIPQKDKPNENRNDTEAETASWWGG